jgi:hypothetical protein
MLPKKQPQSFRAKPTAVLNAASFPPAARRSSVYYLNYSGLDRYNRQGVTFTFDRAARQFHYDGAAWREIVRRYPRSPEAAEARNRLERQTALKTK